MDSTTNMDLCFVGFVLTDLAPPALLGTDGIDLLGALFALRREGVSLV